MKESIYFNIFKTRQECKLFDYIFNKIIFRSWRFKDRGTEASSVDKLHPVTVLLTLRDFLFCLVVHFEKSAVRSLASWAITEQKSAEQSEKIGVGKDDRLKGLALRSKIVIVTFAGTSPGFRQQNSDGSFNTYSYTWRCLDGNAVTLVEAALICCVYHQHNFSKQTAVKFVNKPLSNPGNVSKSGPAVGHTSVYRGSRLTISIMLSWRDSRLNWSRRALKSSSWNSTRISVNINRSESISRAYFYSCDSR